MKNILELNEKLFKMMDQIESGEIDIKTAQTMVNVSQAITGNTKLMLQAAKLAGNPGPAQQMLGINNNGNDTAALPSKSKKDIYEMKLEFSQKNGYGSVAAAIQKLGGNEFERLFREFQNENKL